MIRQLTTRFATATLAIGLTFALVSAANADPQRGRATGQTRGYYNPGYNSGYNYGYHPYYNYPNYGFGVSIGLGGLGYGYGNPGYSSGYGYPSYYTYNSPGYYYSAPSYYNNPSYSTYPSYPSTAVPTGETQSMYRPPMGAAQITVVVPPDARLWIGDFPIVQGGPVRQLVTPPTLEPGKPYHYTLKAEWIENGQRVVRERSVGFQAGEQVNVDFTKNLE